MIRVIAVVGPCTSGRLTKPYLNSTTGSLIPVHGVHYANKNKRTRINPRRRQHLCEARTQRGFCWFSRQGSYPDVTYSTPKYASVMPELDLLIMYGGGVAFRFVLFGCLYWRVERYAILSRLLCLGMRSQVVGNGHVSRSNY